MASQAKLDRLKSIIEYNIRDLREEDAEDIVKLFNTIYKGNYPLPEYLDVDWVRSQVGNERIIVKVFEDKNQTFLGCGVLEYDPNRGTLCGCRTIIYPEHQGKGLFSGAAMTCAQEVLKGFGDKVRIFYGTSRMVPGESSMQRILEKFDFKPVAFLIDMDTGIGQRESEMYQAMIFSQAFRKRRPNPIIIPEVEKVILSVKKHYRKVKDYIIAELKEFSNEITEITILDEPNKYYSHLTIQSGQNFINVLINPKAKSAEIQEYICKDEEKFLTVLFKLTEILRKKDIKYLEACVSAYEPTHQKLFYQAGFKIVGYIPILETVGELLEDRVIMVWLPGEVLTTSLEFTPLSWKFVKPFLDDLGLKGETQITSRGHVRFSLR